jgi:ATP-dependent DNA helicase RecQ
VGTISARNTRALGQLRQRFPELPFMALTATADDTTRLDIVRLLGLNDPLFRSAASTAKHPLYADGKIQAAGSAPALRAGAARQVGIIYCNSRAKVEDTARLQNRGFSARRIMPGLENHIRADVQEKFQRDDPANRGRDGGVRDGDQQTVRFVVHFDIAQYRILLSGNRPRRA